MGRRHQALRRAHRLIVLAAALAAGIASAQNFPARPLRIIVPQSAGGSTDLVARPLAKKLAEALGQSVVVDNRPGAGGNIGTDLVAKSAPDGYTLGLMTSTHIVVSLLFPTPYDAIRDFAPVAGLASGEFMLVVHPSVQAATLQEFIALAKARPEQLNYASSGSGSSSHLATEYFNILAGIRMQIGRAHV